MPNVCMNSIYKVGIVAFCLLICLICVLIYQIVIKNYFDSPYWIKYVIVRDEYVTVNDYIIVNDDIGVKKDE